MDPAFLCGFAPSREPLLRSDGRLHLLPEAPPSPFIIQNPKFIIRASRLAFSLISNELRIHPKTAARKVPEVTKKTRKIFLAPCPFRLFSSRDTCGLPKVPVLRSLRIPAYIDQPRRSRQTPNNPKIVMKPLYSTILALLAAVAGASAQTTATTTPVGYVTATITGNPTNNPSGSVTLVAPPLVQPTVYAGVASAAPTGTTITLTGGGVPATFDSTYVLEVTNGSHAGWWSTVISSTDTTVTVNDSFPSGLDSTSTVAVRLHSTLKNLFGANSLGLTVYDGTQASPDSIAILDPVSQSVTTAVWMQASYSGLPADGWVDYVLFTSLDDTPILPGTAVQVVRMQSTDATLVCQGTVKTTPTQVDIQPNYNWLGQPLATGGTLGSMSFYDQIVKYDGSADTNGNPISDFVELINTDQSVSPYIAADPNQGVGNVMADFVFFSDATSVPISSAGGYLLVRYPSQPASAITIPAQVIGN
jgi:hypothetical protein